MSSAPTYCSIQLPSPFRNTRTTTNTTQIDHLPRETIRDILSRLPLQALITSRYVCKSWSQIYDDLIQDPVFVSLHHPSASGDNFLIVCEKECYFTNLYLVEDNGKRGNSLNLLHTFLHQPRPGVGLWSPRRTSLEPQEIRIFGSANGLICLSFRPDYDYFYICNPITGEILTLPNPKYRGMVDDLHNPGFTGFVYNETTEVYMVFFTHFYNMNADALVLYTYTLGSGIWRCNCDMRGDLFENREAVFLKGAFHLINRPHYRRGINGIDVIEIGADRIKSFEMPPRVDSQNLIGTLMVVKGCLGWIEIERDGSGGIVWMMKDYGVMESWCKEYVISKDELVPLNKMSFKHLKKNGVFICGDGHEDYYYVNKEEPSFCLGHKNRKLQIRGHTVDVLVFAGSLLSPAQVFTTSEMARMAAAYENELKEKTMSDPYQRDAYYTLTVHDELSSEDEEKPKKEVVTALDTVEDAVLGSLFCEELDHNAYDEEWDLGSLFEENS